MYNPLLELDEFDMQARKLALVVFPLQLAVSLVLIVVRIGHRVTHTVMLRASLPLQRDDPQ